MSLPDNQDKGAVASMYFGNWWFESDLASAVAQDTGDRVTFTPTEQSVLRALLNHRGQLLDERALLRSAASAGAADHRRVAFIINRLRRKLGDSARAPRHIATREGEGYVWIARPGRQHPPASGAFIVVGPVHGGFLEDAGACRTAHAFADGLAVALRSIMAPGNRVVLDHQCPSPQDFPEPRPRFAVTLSFLERLDEGLDCAVTLREFATGRVLDTRRVPAQPEGDRGPDDLARALTDAVWLSLNYRRDTIPAADDPPLQIRLHETAEVLANDWGSSWQEAERRLRERRLAVPDDPEAAIMLATTLHTRYVLAGVEALRVQDPRADDEATISALVNAALPHLHGNGLFELAAARLLYFVDPEQRDVARRLAEAAFERTSAFAAGYATLGQIRMWDGHFDDAVRFYDRALEMAEPGSHFRSYLLVLRCKARIAEGGPAAGCDAATVLYTEDHHARHVLCLFYEPAAAIDLGAERQRLLDRLDAASARAALLVTHYLTARFFPRREQQRNSLITPAGWLVPRFGARIIPGEIRHLISAADFPERRRPN